MAQPITWQNVNGPNYSGISGVLQAAQNSFSNAFSGVQDVLKERAALEAANAVATKQNNTQAYLDRIAQFQSPEQLQAAIADGSLERARQGYGTQIDQSATRNAAQAMLGDRYKQVQAATEFGNTMLNEKTAPIMDRFKQASITGNEAAKEAARAEYAAAGGKHGADLEQFAQTTSRDNMKWNETTKSWVRDEQKFQADLKHMQNQDANAAAQTAIASRNASVNEKELKLREKDFGIKEEDRLNDRILKINSSLGDLGSRKAASGEGTETVYKAISQNIKDPKAQENARLAFSEMLLKNPDITTAAATAGVLTVTKSGWWNILNIGEGSERTEAARVAKALTNTPESKAIDQANEAKKAVLLEQLKAARSKQSGASTSVVNPLAPRG